MNTTFIPINTAQMSNALTDMGTWIGAYFPAFLGLAFFIGAIVIVPLVLKGLLSWIYNGLENLVAPKTWAEKEGIENADTNKT